MGEARPIFDYWSSRPLSQGQSFECAGLEKPVLWLDVLRHLTDLNATEHDVASVQSSTPEIFRCIVTRQGKLQFAFFASERPVQASRYWLQQQLGKAVNPTTLLAGRPAMASADSGPILCTCNSIGRNTLQTAIAAMPGASLQAICHKTKAGEGCGSCRPEIQRMINETPGFAQAAE